MRQQASEEKSVQDMIDELVLAGKNPDALLRIDKEAGCRCAHVMPGISENLMALSLFTPQPRS